MNARDAICEIAKFLNEEKQLFVDVVTRDNDNCVISRAVYPVDNIFSHELGIVKICCEESKKL